MNGIKTNEKIIIGRTDLAKDEYEKYQGKQLPDFGNEEFEIKNISVTKNIVGNQAATILQKQPGNYYTIDLSNCNIHDNKTLEDIEHTLATVLKDMLEELHLVGKKAFVVGLGNSNVTPDAIGPYVIDNTIVTRHLYLIDALSEGFSCVSAMSPGVMGTTGIETYDIIESMIKKIDVDFVIVVDALATNSIKRINKTIQLTDTGIKPGSGVGNKRKELSLQTLGIPVIAIGVPTVVDATTITVDAIQMTLKYLYLESENKTSYANKLSPTLVYENLNSVEDMSDIHKEAFLGPFGKLTEEQQRTLIEEVLTPQGYNLMVTPKEIDVEVEDLSKIIANGINLAVHSGLYNGQSE